MAKTETKCRCPVNQLPSGSGLRRGPDCRPAHHHDLKPLRFLAWQIISGRASELRPRHREPSKPSERGHGQLP